MIYIGRLEDISKAEYSTLTCFALTKDQYAIVLNNGSQSMSNGQQSAIVEFFLNSSLNFVIRSKVNTSGSCGEKRKEKKKRGVNM